MLRDAVLPDGVSRDAVLRDAVLPDDRRRRWRDGEQVRFLPVAVDIVRAPLWLVGWLSALLWFAASLVLLAGAPGGACLFALIAVAATARAIYLRRPGSLQEPGPRRLGVQTTDELRLTRVPGHFILILLFILDAALLTALLTGTVR